MMPRPERWIRLDPERLPFCSRRVVPDSLTVLRVSYVLANCMRIGTLLLASDNTDPAPTC